MTKARDVSSRGGLTQVIPTSIAVGSGSGSVSANGAVTFTGATSVSLNGCFTTNYDNYRIIIDTLSASASGTNPYIRLRSSGTDITATNYFAAGRRIISWGGASSDMFFSGTTYWPIADSNIESNAARNYVIDVQNPFKSLVKGYSVLGAFSGASYYGSTIYTGTYRVSSPIDGISLIAVDSSGGTIRVYGYNNG